MISKVEAELIIEYVFKNEDHLRIALAIMYDCPTELRQRTIAEFMVPLEAKLKEAFPDWHVENHFTANVFEKFVGLYLSRNNWGEGYKIGFEA